jgi:hypothetical protein
LAIDDASNIFLTGLSPRGLPVTPGVLKPELNPGAGQITGFAMKINTSGTALLYSTYIGGTVADEPAAIAIDGLGNAYVAGVAHSPDFPTTPGAIKRTCRLYAGTGGSICWIAFVMKINPTASAMVYSTMLGGDGDAIAEPNGVSSNATDVAVDRDGFLYVTGSTFTTDFPTTPGSLKPSTTTRDAYVAKLNRGGTGLIYSTYLGGDAGSSAPFGGFESGGGIAVDETGSAYVSGLTCSDDFPVVDAVQSPIGSPNCADPFVVRMNPPGTALTFATYLGGSREDWANSIAIQGDNVYAAGWTMSSDFPLVNAANPVPPTVLNKSFLAKMSVPRSCGSDETPNVEMFDSGFLPTIFWPITLQVVALRNRTATPIAGPLTFVMDNLQSAVSIGSSQITRCLSPEGDPVMLVPVGNDNALNPNETTLFALWFFPTRLAAITYTPRVLGATGTR